MSSCYATSAISRCGSSVPRTLWIPTARCCSRTRCRRGPTSRGSGSIAGRARVEAAARDGTGVPPLDELTYGEPFPDGPRTAHLLRPPMGESDGCAAGGLRGSPKGGRRRSPPSALRPSPSAVDLCADLSLKRPVASPKARGERIRDLLLAWPLLERSNLLWSNDRT